MPLYFKEIKIKTFLLRKTVNCNLCLYKAFAGLNTWNEIYQFLGAVGHVYQEDILHNMSANSKYFELFVEFHLCYLYSCPLEICAKRILFTGFSNEEMLKELLNAWLKITGLQSTTSCPYRVQTRLFRISGQIQMEKKNIIQIL